MELVGTFFDEEFDFLKMFTNVDADFMLSDPADNFCQNFGIAPPSFFPDEANNDHMMAQNFYLQSFDTLNIKSYGSQECSNSSGSENQVYFPNGSCEENQDNNVNSFLTLTNDNGAPKSMNFFAMDNQNEHSLVPALTDNVVDKNVLSNASHQGVATLPSGSKDQLKRKFDVANEKSCNDSNQEAPKKKSRAPRDTQKNKRSNGGQKKKNKKNLEDNISNANEHNNESTENGGKQIQVPTSSMSEDDSNASLEPNGDVTTSECNDSLVPNSKGKTRATRGNATDPQSLYARKRRERINERLRILQTLVPNGTKVDISTMLEEAVQYVKFLQLQIQLLSSDDMWMYAPLAYNGIDVGVYQGMFPNL
ncbi:hypothetical protein Leryth_005382 [Lithospermum erythrorhizon]|nr:hypothetical protein Leryth_005382 [Lithospermum erythrorhizon]